MANRDPKGYRARVVSKGPKAHAVRTISSVARPKSYCTPELVFDGPVSEGCTTWLKGNFEFQEGNAAAITAQIDWLSEVAALPFSHMPDGYPYRLFRAAFNSPSNPPAEERGHPCYEDALRWKNYYVLQDKNPLGDFRQGAVYAWWVCTLPDTNDPLGNNSFNDGGTGLSEDCDALLQWIPAAWIPNRGR